MIPKRVQTIVDSIAKECNKRFGNKITIIWFGSWVKGNAYKQSDIDLAIEFHGELQKSEIIAFKDWLDDFPTLYSIDLVDMDKASDLLKTEIRQYGRIL